MNTPTPTTAPLDAGPWWLTTYETLDDAIATQPTSPPF